MVKRKKSVMKKIKKMAKPKTMLDKGKSLLARALKDPIVKEYIEDQKKLARKTLKKAMAKAQKKL